MSENDLDNLLESIDLGDSIKETETIPGEDIKQSEKELEDTKPVSTDTASVAVQVGGATLCNGPQKIIMLVQ